MASAFFNVIRLVFVAYFFKVFKQFAQANVSKRLTSAWGSSPKDSKKNMFVRYIFSLRGIAKLVAQRIVFVFF